MRSSLKLLTALALAATLLAGCKGGKEEDHSLDEFSATVGLGIYKDGNPVFTFLKNTHQYYCNPRKAIRATMNALLRSTLGAACIHGPRWKCKPT